MNILNPINLEKGYIKKMDKIFVKIAEMKTGKAPSVIITMGLGSCVAVTFYDRKNKTGGLLHFLLPENPTNDSSYFKYGDTGIKEMIRIFRNNGSRIEDIEAKIVGGSVMFTQLLKNTDNAVGPRNVKIAKEILEKSGIRIVGEDTGGDYGRSVEFYLETGELKVSSYKTGIKII